MRSQVTRWVGWFIGLTLLVVIVQNILWPFGMAIQNVISGNGPRGLYPTPPDATPTEWWELVVFFGALLLVGMPIAWLLGRYRHKWTKD